jgi:hypothetical protein
MIQLKKAGSWIPFTRTFRRLLIKYAINFYRMRCLWVSKCVDAYGWDLIRIGGAVSNDIRDIGCPTEESSRTIVFHLVDQQNIGDFWLRPCAFLRRWYEPVSSRQGFSGMHEVEHVVGKAFVILGFIRRMSIEFRGTYTVRSLYTSLVRPKWSTSAVYGVHSITCMYTRLDVYDMLCVVWVGRILTICHHKSVFLCLDTLVKRSFIAFIIFILYILSCKMNSPNFLSALDLNTPRYRTRSSEFLRIGFHRTSSWTDICCNTQV